MIEKTLYEKKWQQLQNELISKQKEVFRLEEEIMILKKSLEKFKILDDMHPEIEELNKSLKEVDYVG